MQVLVWQLTSHLNGQLDLIFREKLTKVRRTPSQLRSHGPTSNFYICYNLYFHRNAWANWHPLGHEPSTISWANVKSLKLYSHRSAWANFCAFWAVMNLNPFSPQLVHREYFADLNYYSVARKADELPDPDERIAEDVRKTAETFALTFRNGLYAASNGLWATLELAHFSGWDSPGRVCHEMSISIETC
jgi:hypothetical protein